MNAKNVIISLVLGLLILIIGMVLGVVYQGQKASTKTVASQPVPEAMEILSSKAISSIGAYGTVSKIVGDNVTLVFGGDSLTIGILPMAPIYSIVTITSPKSGSTPAKTTQATKQITLGDIKVGDSLSVNVKVLANGQVQGLSVIDTAQ